MTTISEIMQQPTLQNAVLYFDNAIHLRGVAGQAVSGKTSDLQLFSQLDLGATSAHAKDLPAGFALTFRQTRTVLSSGDREASPLEGDMDSRPLREFPPLLGLAAHDPAITDQVRSVLTRLWSVTASKALSTGFPLTRCVVDIESDPEELTRTPVLRFYCQATAVQTFAFWDSLDLEMTRWLRDLDRTERDAVLTSAGLRFHWLER